MSRKLASKTKKKKENPGLEITQSLYEYALALLIAVICVVVPLYMKNGYYKIGDAKFAAYAKILEFGLPIVLVFWVLYQSFDIKEKGFVKKLKEIPRQMSVTDWFFAAFFLIVLISYLASGNMELGFWGYDGWFMGLFFQATILILYLLLSRNGNYYKLVLSVLCAVACITYVIGILHRLLIDVLGTYEGISDYYKTQFLSTLGQASWYSSFVCTVLPLGVGCYFIAKQNHVRWLSMGFTLVGFMTLVTQNSDSAYIATALLFLVLFYFAVESADSMMRLMEIAAMFLIAPKLMRLLLWMHPNPVLDLDQLSHMLVFSGIPLVLLVVVSAIWGILFYGKKKGVYFAKQMRVFRNVVYAVVLLLLLFSVVVLRLSAKGQLTGGLLQLSQTIPYLSWDHTWGNGRGFTWEATAKIIREFPIKNKLIGVGPDCFQSYAYAHYEAYIRSQWGENILTNAHNEWMNMIVNYGFLGAISYIGIFLSAFFSFIKHAKKEPALILCAGCIAAYMGHNLFCYQQVLCTPFVIIVIGYGAYIVRGMKENKG